MNRFLSWDEKFEDANRKSTVGFIINYIQESFFNTFIALLQNFILNVEIWYKNDYKIGWMRIMPFLKFSLNYTNLKNEKILPIKPTIKKKKEYYRYNQQ